MIVMYIRKFFYCSIKTVFVFIFMKIYMFGL